MQPLIDRFAGPLGQNVGLLLLAILTISALWLIAGTVRRFYWQNRQYQLSVRLLELRIKEAECRLRQAQAGPGWNGYRKFAVAKKERECEGVYSFYLEPHDRKPLPTFLPGQFLTFRLRIPGVQEDVIRCYSLSDSASSNDEGCKSYRVTIKKVERAPGSLGSVSTFFCDQIEEGDILDVEAPRGDFTLDLERATPVVLIAAGVGVTPMICMLNALLDHGSKRETWFFYGVGNSEDHIFREYLRSVAAKHPHVRFRICYSRPNSTDQLDQDYQHAGRLSVSLMKELLPSANYEFFVCGPPAMMDEIQRGLKEWGVPENYIRSEAFGPRLIPPIPPAGPTDVPSVQVTFRRSGKRLPWNPRSLNLLQFARQNGVAIRSGCEEGNCNSCVVAVISGDVKYQKVRTTAAGSCLTCICEPKSDVVLDA
jgi:ferredoxin-NADP reductase